MELSTSAQSVYHISSDRPRITLTSGCNQMHYRESLATHWSKLQLRTISEGDPTASRAKAAAEASTPTEPCG